MIVAAVPVPAADPAGDGLAQRLLDGQGFLVVGERQFEPDLGHVERVEQRGGDELGQQVAGIGARVRGDGPPVAAQPPQRGRHHAEQQRPRLFPQQRLYLVGANLQRAPQVLGEGVLPGAVAEQGLEEAGQCLAPGSGPAVGCPSGP